MSTPLMVRLSAEKIVFVTGACDMAPIVDPLHFTRDLLSEKCTYNEAEAPIEPAGDCGGKRHEHDGTFWRGA